MQDKRANEPFNKLVDDYIEEEQLLDIFKSSETFN